MSFAGAFLLSGILGQSNTDERCVTAKSLYVGKKQRFTSCSRKVIHGEGVSLSGRSGF